MPLSVRAVPLPTPAAVALSCLALLAGCGSPGGPAGVASGGTPPAPRPPVMACESLAGLAVPATAFALPTRGATVDVALVVAASPGRAAEGRWLQALPAHCSVAGRIHPVDPAAPDIRWRLNVPVAWNGGVIQVGGGGLNGRIPANLALIGPGGSPTSAAFPPDAPSPLARGLAMFGGDSGHAEPGLDARWALNDEAWRNFAHEGLKKTRDAAVAVLRRLHGEGPRRTWFMGQSQGGREALEVAQRYPEDYDGVLATAPLLGYAPHVLHKTLLAGLQTGDGWIPPAKLPAIAAEVLRQCDALDGLVDGLIGHYRACAARLDGRRQAPDWIALRCEGGADTDPGCLSDAQLTTLRRMHAPLDLGYPLAHGLTRFAGYPAGREAQPGWLNINPRPVAGTPPALGQPGATVRFGILKDPAADLLALDPARERTRIQAASALIDSTNPDLSRFFARGGRMIVKLNGADTAANPHTMMAYLDALEARFGRAVVDRHVRLYVLPHAGHGGDVNRGVNGPPAARHVDLVGMALDWVERGVAPPDAPVVTLSDPLPPHAVRESALMCRYPAYPRYRGTGDTTRAASFTCVTD